MPFASAGKIITKTKTDPMDNTTLFAVGTVIFVLYLGSYLLMVSHQNRIQKGGQDKPKI